MPDNRLLSPCVCVNPGLLHVFTCKIANPDVYWSSVNQYTTVMMYIVHHYIDLSGGTCTCTCVVIVRRISFIPAYLHYYMSTCTCIDFLVFDSCNKYIVISTLL